jgi:hypothetical protein
MMIPQLDVFCEMPCLTERFGPFSGLALHRKWFKTADKRLLSQYLHKFVDYNSDLLRFLGVEPLVAGLDQNVALTFRSSQFIGSIPLRAPDSGKQIGDFVVTPRFSGTSRFEDYIEIIDILKAEIGPEVINSLPLTSRNNFRPPLYLEAVKFVSSLEQLTKTQWRKFDNILTMENDPTGHVNWNQYIQKEHKVENRLRFPTQKSILTEYHKEYAEIRYVFDICKRELFSSNTPLRIKNSLRPRVVFLEQRLYGHKPIETNAIAVRAADSPRVRNCKVLANKILRYKLIDSTAWRVNFSDVFEKFVQHVFRISAKETGAKLLSNHRFYATPVSEFGWALKHVEPDAIYYKENFQIFIDAKYKSNLYNKYNLTEKLKEDHRYDVHQLLAYCSFSSTVAKIGFLCYPSTNLELYNVRYKNRVNAVSNTIMVLGVPLKKEIIDDAKKLMISALTRIENECSPVASRIPSTSPDNASGIGA